MTVKLQSGDYQIVEARTWNNPQPSTAVFRVYRTQASDPISEHDTFKQAKLAVARYQDGDKRRNFRQAV